MTSKKDLKVNTGDFYSMMAAATAEPEQLEGQMEITDIPGVDPAQDAQNAQESQSDDVMNVVNAIASGQYNKQVVEELSKALARKQRKIYTDEEVEMFKAAYKTQGKAGLHIPRINVALEPELYDYVRTVSKAQGRTYSQFIAEILRQHYEGHRDLYARAKAFQTEIKGSKE